MLGEAVRSRIAGPDAPQRAAQIWGKPGVRRFGPEDPIWQVHADAAMLVGGLRALLLQSLHPLAMAGVAGHSGFRSDPWGRLQRTSHFIATTTFAVVEDADRAVRIVRAVHRRVTGTTPDGAPYAASDPHLLRWVHLAEVDSFLDAYQRYGKGRLSLAQADEYVAQTGVTATALGVLDPPGTVAELEAGLDSYRGELRATVEARDVAKFLLLDPPLPAHLRPAYGTLAVAAAATLPSYARRMLRIPRVPVLTPVAGTIAGQVGVRGVRWMLQPSAPQRGNHNGRG